MSNNNTLALLLCLTLIHGVASTAPLRFPAAASLSERIYGGSEAEPHAWPHQAAVFIDNAFYCGGSLISDRWVMTAAHCVDDYPRNDHVKVVLGAHNIQVEEPSQQTFASTNYFTHEDWNPVLLTNDIALIQLPQAVQFNEYIQPVKLPSSDIPVGTEVIATGWGHTFTLDPTINDVLKEVPVTVVDNMDCNADYGSITDNMVCGANTGAGNTCDGDSGGPLNYGGMTFGITSFWDGGCQGEQPHVFTRVYNYLDWIYNKTQITP